MPLFKVLVEESAAPLKADRDDVRSPMATGFATNTYSRWFDHKYGEEKKLPALGQGCTRWWAR